MSSQSDTKPNFDNWFKNILEMLYPNQHAGFAILMISMPLLERFLREKTGLNEATSLSNPFFEELIKVFPALTSVPVARGFWEIYRHGLLHQSTLISKEIELKSANKPYSFLVSPEKFSRKICVYLANHSAASGRGQRSRNSAG
jgi:hypothetical protein